MKCQNLQPSWWVLRICKNRDIEQLSEEKFWGHRIDTAVLLMPVSSVKKTDVSISQGNIGYPGLPGLPGRRGRDVSKIKENYCVTMDNLIRFVLLPTTVLNCVQLLWKRTGLENYTVFPDISLLWIWKLILKSKNCNQLIAKVKVCLRADLRFL